MKVDNPFPDTMEDIERRAIVGRIESLRQMVKVIESAAASVVEGLDELERRLGYQDDGDASDESADIPTLVRRHRRRSR